MTDKEFGTEKQKLLIEYLLSDESVFQRSNNIIKSEYFDKGLQKPVQYILEHASKYNAVPNLDQLNAETGSNFQLTGKIREHDQAWALDNIEKFCKRMAIVLAVWEAPDSIESGEYGHVEQLIKDALLVGLQKDLGTNYFEDPKTRLERIRQRNLVPTGWHEIDKKLYGGLNRGELTLFVAGSGVGKSLFLQNWCLNMVFGPSYVYNDKEMKHNPMDVVYITLELSEDLVSKRLDTMVTAIDPREIFKKIDEVELKVRAASKKAGRLTVKYMSSGSTVNDIKAYLKEYEIKFGKKPDALAVDYLDLLHPSSKSISVSDFFIKDKYVTEELRALAAEMDVLCTSASQLNRSAVDQTEHNQSMIAGGLSKIQTADNVVSIFASPGMKERGEYQCQFIKTRSSAGVDSKVHLGFDVVSLRIYNLAEGHEVSVIPQPSLREKLDITKKNTAIIKKIDANVVTQPEIASFDPETGEIQENTPTQAENPLEKLKRLHAKGQVK